MDQAVCDRRDLERFRLASLASARAMGADRAALERWRPPAPVAARDRATILAAVRRYLDLCGLGEAVSLTRSLVAFPTVSSEEPPASGPSFAAMRSFLESWSRESGLAFRNVGANDAWEVTLGEGPRNVALVMHADVVPATDESTRATGWTTPPFEATIRGDRLYGRGAEDDKGPIATALVVLRTLARAGLGPERGQILAVLGTGEESDWEGMKRYAASEPHARHVISLDAEFPVVVAESGFVAWRIGARDDRRARPRSTRAVAVGANAGQFLTQVPGEASLTLEPRGRETVQALLERARAAAASEAARGGDFRAEAELDADRVVVRAHGEAVHSSVAEEGSNALWLLSAIASRLDLEPNAIATILEVVHRELDGDHWGERLGLAYEHPAMGRLLVAPTMLRYEDGLATLSINMRRPAGMTSPEFAEKLDGALARLRASVNPAIEELPERYVGEPALADTSGPLVPTLLDVYRRHQRDPAATPISIRGGTYARLFPGAVSFGPSVPGNPYRGHAPDEYIELGELHALLGMLFEALVRLDTPDGG